MIIPLITTLSHVYLQKIALIDSEKKERKKENDLTCCLYHWDYSWSWT